MAEDETWEDLAKRLAALVIKLDERNEKLDDRNERLDTWIAGQATINDRLTSAVERIETTLADIKTLMTEVFRQRHNGHEA
jgi:hypothetical protein